MPESNRPEPGIGNALPTRQLRRETQKLTVGNCAMTFVCFKRWDELVEDPNSVERRFCAVCERNVYLCRSTDEFARRGRAGECVAVILEETSASIKFPTLLGVPLSPGDSFDRPILESIAGTTDVDNESNK